MHKSWTLWAAGAIFLFWLVGANNRLVRLRAAALQAYAVLDGALVRQLDFVRAQLAAQEDAEAAHAAQADAVAAPASISLRAAANQLATLLASTRARPLEPQHMAALATALQAVLAAWQRCYPDAVLSFGFDGTVSRPAPLLGPGEAPQAAPASTPLAWPEPSAAAEIARGQFNLAVGCYNTAIAQFPSLLVAWVARLRAAAPLL